MPALVGNAKRSRGTERLFVALARSQFMVVLMGLSLTLSWQPFCGLRKKTELKINLGWNVDSPAFEILITDFPPRPRSGVWWEIWVVFPNRVLDIPRVDSSRTM